MIRKDQERRIFEICRPAKVKNAAFLTVGVRHQSGTARI